jgi:lysophospholipase L1-like esterase
MQTRPIVVACLGSSSTAGKGQVFGWIDELQKRPGNERFSFRNLGVGGDFSYNALQRVGDVVAARPDKVVLLIGANDILAIAFQKMRLMKISKRLPRDPSPEWFHENMEVIVRRLKSETSAEIGLCSLGQVGEAPDSDDPAQRELNHRYAQFNGIIAQVARGAGITLIPFYERLKEQIAASPGKALTEFRFLPIYRDTFRSLILHQSSDEIAAKNGWKFHVDGIHLNQRGGLILAELVQEFLDR